MSRGGGSIACTRVCLPSEYRTFTKSYFEALCRALCEAFSCCATSCMYWSPCILVGLGRSLQGDNGDFATADGVISQQRHSDHPYTAELPAEQGDVRC